MNKIIISDDKNMWVRAVNETLVKDMSGEAVMLSTISLNKASYALPAGAMVKTQYSIGELTKLMAGGVQLSFPGVADIEQ